MKRVLYTLLSVWVLLAVLFSVVMNCVGSADTLYAGFIDYASADGFGVTRAELPELAKDITGYVTGRQETMQSADRFNEKETEHLRDVRRLLGLGSVLRYTGAGLFLALCAFGYFFGHDKAAFFRDIVRGLSHACMALTALTAVLCIWGAVDFNGLFWTLHKVLFRNDLWMMDPNADLLGALMPLGLFSWYGGMLLKNIWPLLALILILPFAVRERSHTKKEDTAENAGRKQ